jgi:hypothetical protein
VRKIRKISKSNRSIPSENSHRFFYKIKNKNILIYILLGVGAFLLYGRTINFSWGMDDGFIIDILKGIENNWSGFSTVFTQRIGEDYRPFTVLSFWLEKTFFGDFNPGHAHLINVAFFGLLLVQIFRFVLKGNFYLQKDTAFALALIVVLIFLIHPMHISVVANIKSRDNIFSMLFGVTSAIQMIQFFKDRKKSRVFWILLLLIIAELSKSDAYVFAFFAFLYYFIYAPYKYKFNFKFFAILIILFNILINVPSMVKTEMMNNFIGESIQYRVHVDSPLMHHDTIINRLSLSFTTMLYYLKFFILPFGHFSYYGYNHVSLMPLFSITNILSFFIYTGLLVFSILKFKSQKLFLFSFIFYLLAIAYASNLPVIVSGVLADRYNFIGSLGLSMFTATLILQYSNEKSWKVVLKPWFIILIAIFTAFNIHRTADWKNKETLFLSDIQKGSKSAHLHQMLSSIYINDALFADLPKDLADSAMSKAIFYIDKGLAISQFNPFLFENKGISKLYKNNITEAKVYFRKGIQLDSTVYSIHNYIGICFRNENKLDSALHYFAYAMNHETIFNYAANNYIEMLIRKQQYKSVDSTLVVLQKRFPTDKYLKQKIDYLKTSGSWYAY